MPRDDLYLFELVEAADRIGSWLAGVSQDRWTDEEMLRRAVLQSLTVIGEAARALQPALKDRHPGVPWRDIVAFRNVAVHEYFAVEWPTVWHIASQDLPVLREQAFDVLRVEFPEIASRYEQRG